MMDKLQKLEELVNGVLTKIIAWLSLHLCKFLPHRLIAKISTKRKSIVQRIKGLITAFVKKFKTNLEKAHLYKENIKAKHETAKNIPIRNQLFLAKQFIKENSYKNLLHSIGKFLVSFKLKISKVIKNTKASQFALPLAALIMIGSGLTSVYMSSNDIIQKEFPTRKPASVQEYDYRPEYLQFKQKTMKILNVKLPVYFDKIGEVKTITVDFSVRTSTRFAKNYLEEFEYKLKDYFFSTAEPVLSKFQLEEEGKEVIKEVMTRELNTFLQNENVEGEVVEIKLLYVIGT